MQVEFYSKQGVVAQLCRLQNKFGALILSGQWSTVEFWDLVIPDPMKSDTEEEGTVSAMAFMIAETGALNAFFDTREDAITWIHQVRINHDKLIEDREWKTPIPVMIHLFDDTGEQIAHCFVHQFEAQDYTNPITPGDVDEH